MTGPTDPPARTFRIEVEGAPDSKPEPPTAGDERALVVVEPAPLALFGTIDPLGAFDMALTLAERMSAVVESSGLFQEIETTDRDGVVSVKRYVNVEAWALCGAALGIYPHVVGLRRVPDGPDGEFEAWEAEVELRSLGGTVVTNGMSQVSRSENQWARSETYALKSMAQTRATAKAWRLGFGFVMKVAGFEGTPAEEMAAPAAPAQLGAGLDPEPPPKPPQRGPGGGDPQTEKVAALVRTGLEQFELSEDLARVFDVTPTPRSVRARVEFLMKGGGPASEDLPRESAVTRLMEEVIAKLREPYDAGERAAAEEEDAAEAAEEGSNDGGAA
jgi:hypothetical protein